MNVWPCTGPSEPWVWGGVRAVGTAEYLPATGLLTEVEVAALVLGLEEAAARLGVDVGPLGHQELHVVLAAALDGDVQGGLAWRGRARSPRLRLPQSRDQTALRGRCTVWKWGPQARPTLAAPKGSSGMRHL